MRLRFGALALVLSVSLVCPLLAFGITIDTFDGEQSNILLGSPEFKSTVIQSNYSIGGFRQLDSSLGKESFFLASVVGNGYLSHSQGDGDTGNTQVVWDGNNNNSSVNPSGLGGIDFTEDGGTAIKLVVRNFDFPFSKSVSLQFDVYDSTDSLGKKFSRSTLTLNHQLNNTTFELPFNNFAPQGANGGVDFRHVGAVVLNILGENPAVDISFELIGTNGNCSLVPLPGGVIVDQCGVCGGDSSSCKDCAGVPNGPSLPGVSCEANNPGFCGSGTYNQSCQCIQQKVPDPCGVCGGDGASCLTCDERDDSLIHFLLDAAAKAQERIINHALNVLAKVAPDKNTAKYIAKTKARAHVLQIRNWTLSWELPRIYVECGTTPLCVKVSNMDKVNEYRKHNIELRDLARQVNKRILKLSKKYAKDAKYNIKAADSKYRHALDLTYQVPEDQSVCSVPYS